MSKLVQKTLHSINSVLNNSGIFYSDKEKLNPRNFSIASFQEHVKTVESRTEEEELVTKYLSRIEKRLSEPDVSCAEVEEMVKICMVCETMGYKAEFIYVHSLKLAQKGNLQQKHTGYLAADFFLDPNHELVILLINTIQKDLNSSNSMEVILALTAVCHLISRETVHNIMHIVEEKLSHQIPSVRKCAVLTLSHCLSLVDSESAYQIIFPKLEKCLSDTELDVVSVVVPTLHKVIKKLPGDFTYILDSLILLQDQILMRRIPHSMNYSDIPAPWLQVEILKLMRCLCKSSENSSKLSSILKKTLAQTGLYHAIAQAIVYQVLETVACITADAELLEIAMSSVSLLLKSRDVNMKFMGLEALILIVKKNEPNITPAQQDVIIGCLKLSDETLQLKTLELMYHLANSANVQPICSKMIEFLDQIKEAQKKRDLIEKILQLAEKYKNRHHWYTSVVSAVLTKVDPVITNKDICKILDVINEDEKFKEIAKKEFIQILEKDACDLSSMIKLYTSLLSEPSEFSFVFPFLENADEDSVIWILTLLMESILKHKTVPPECTEFIPKLEKKFSHSSILAILLQQTMQIILSVADMSKMEPGTKVDPSLSCLDGYVLESLNNSEDLYEPQSLRMVSLSSEKSTTSFTNNSFCVLSTGRPSSQNCDSSFTLQSLAYSTFSSPSVSFQSLSSEIDAVPPIVKKKTVWTKEGRSKKSVSIEEKEDDLLQLFAGVSSNES